MKKQKLYLLVIVGCFALAAFIYSLSIVHDGITGDPGTNGINGKNGANGLPGENGVQGNAFQAVSISQINITDGQTVSLFTQNSPNSSNKISANTIRIGDAMNVEINFDTFPIDGGNTIINFACTSGQLENIVLPDSAMHKSFAVKMTVIFNTLTTVNIFNGTSAVFNVPFDTTIDQFMSLTLHMQNIATCSVYNFSISKQTSM